MPVESAELGETLWVVAGWLVLAAIAGWLSWREGRAAWRVGRPELALGLLAAAQVASCVAVLLTSGQQRTALNMLWEWIGIAVAFLLLRGLFRDAAARVWLLRLLLTAGVVLAGFGMWQRLVWYPQVQAAYLKWESLTSGEADISLSPAERSRRIEQLQRDLGPHLLSLEGSSRLALRQRILDSREPFGRFALANTFGGVMAALWLLSLCLWGRRNGAGAASTDEAVDLRTPTAGGRRVLLLAVQGLIGLALLWTRSRTAWTGAVCGALSLAVARTGWGGQALSARRGWLVAVAGGLLIGGVVTFAAVAGAVDRQDLVEAPKSLQYRLQYWAGAWQIIREHPWLGCGPGNYRPAYQQVKWPEASEDVADPHNLVFDVWANAGPLALIGLLWLCGQALLLCRDAVQRREPSGNDDPELRGEADAGIRARKVEHFARSGNLSAGLVACGLLFVVTDLCFGRIDIQLLWLAAAWAPAAWMVDRLVHTTRRLPGAMSACSLAAGVALTVHLLGSGGIAMPGVTLLWLTLWFVLPEHSRPEIVLPRVVMPGAAAVSVVLLLAQLWSAWAPVMASGVQLRAGQYDAFVLHRLDRAAQSFRAAAAADPLDPNPWAELAGVELALAETGVRDAERHFALAVEAAQQAIERDPLNPLRYSLLGDVWFRRHRLEPGSEAAARAIEAYSIAVARYPNSSRLWAQYALALAAAPSPAETVQAAQRALELDEINRTARHYDKVLPEELRTSLRAITSAAAQRDEAAPLDR